MSEKNKEKFAAGEKSTCERLADSRRQGESLLEFGLAELTRLKRVLRFLAPLPWLWISTLAQKKGDVRKKSS